MHGMYIFGNAETCGRVEMWSKVLKMLGNGGNIGKQLELRCPRHPNLPISIAEPSDFHLYAPEGGCNERCEWRLSCGHPCVKKCHSDFLHENTVCYEHCDRSFKHCNHSCPNPCGIVCGDCNVRVTGVSLPCGHVPSSLLCHQLQNLPEVRCKAFVQQTLSACGHTLQRQCWQKPADFKCKERCEAILPCGHQCESMCRKCNREQIKDGHTSVISVHAPCVRPCGRKYTNCSHNCITPCHGTEKCAPCIQQCEIRCEHSRCGKQCTDPCAPCAELCSWTCIHRTERCEMPCAVPCDINPCSERCQNLLQCSHQCPSICGERCPPMEFCQICGTEDVRAREVDLIMFEPYSEIDLNTNPIIVPTCGHFYTVETYDSHMGIKNCYILDDSGAILAPKGLDGSSDVTENSDDPPEKLVVKNCPDCRAPLRDIHRYNRIVKSAFLDESTKRFCANAQAKYLNIYQQASRTLEILQANQADFIAALRSGQPNTPARGRPPPPPTGKIPQPILDRIGKRGTLSRKIKRFIQTVSEEEQPYSKVRQMVLAAQRRRGVQTTFVGDPSAVQMGFRLKSQNLLLEAVWEGSWDLHQIGASSAVDAPTARMIRERLMKELRRHYQSCSIIIMECLSAKLTKYEVEARIRGAQFCALYRLESMTQKTSAAPTGNATSDGVSREVNSDDDFGEEIRQAERKSLDRCDELCNSLPGTVGPMKDQVNQARILLGGGTFYTTVSAEEKRLVHEAMSAEFSSTGRWYTCPNGHPVYPNSHPQFHR